MVSTDRPRGPAETIAAVGHEIHTPLAIALMHLGMLDRAITGGASPRVARALLDVARAEIRRADRLVYRVLQIQRGGPVLMHPAFTDLVQVVSRAAEQAIPDGLGVTVKIDATSRGLLGWWDEETVEQIVQNLLSNALKFGNGKDIDVAVARARTGARIRVRDRGARMTAADRRRLLAQRTPPRSAGLTGLGLGLWLVRGLAEAHGGRLSVRSPREGGTAFAVTLRPITPGTRLVTPPRV